MSYQLRDYQQQCVQAVVHFFRKSQDPAVVVLPTGAGKSLVIAELARIAKGRVLVLAHVKELVEQNCAKYQQYGLQAGIYAAGLGLKQTTEQVIFASIQSISRNLAEFAASFSLLVIDECHRVPDDENSSYRKVISHLQQFNPGIKILGLTATPYRLGSGFIYQYHSRGLIRAETPKFFKWCIFELPIRHLLSLNYLTAARVLDAPVLSYDFSGLKPAIGGNYREQDLNWVIEKAKRITPQIVTHIMQYAQEKLGVMIFAATTAHAREIVSLLPADETAIVLAGTPLSEREAIIAAFKARQLKYLVNVSVLTTGFDAPHVDLIAILRPTESVSLYQQIVGRGLRLYPGKTECLVLDYAGNLYDLYSPEIGSPAPVSDAEQVTIPCPLCQFRNTFWGKVDSNGHVIEHYGRRCQGFSLDNNQQPVACGYRFVCKFCPECGAEQDIAARQCQTCQTVLVDPDKKLKEAMALKDALVFYPTQMQLERFNKDHKAASLKITYRDELGNQLHEYYAFTTAKQKNRVTQVVLAPHVIDRHRPFTASNLTELLAQQHRLQPPAAVIARKEGRFWKLREKLFQLKSIEN